MNEVHGLRDMPPGQEEAPPSTPGWHRYRLVPLLILLLAVIAATTAGVLTDRKMAAAEATAAAAAPSATSTAPPSLPDMCNAPTPVLAAQQPWVGAARTASEAAFQKNISKEPHPEVLAGKDGFVFWGDIQVNNVSQGLGRKVLSAAELDKWYAHYKALADQLKAQGITFVIVVAPAKWDVYSDKLPDWAQQLRGATTLDYLRIVHPDLPIIDVRDDLRKASATAPTYTPLNSHWSAFGAYSAYSRIAACLASLNPADAKVAPAQITGTTSKPMANEFASFGHPGDNPQAYPVYATAPAAMTLTDKTGTSTVTTEQVIDKVDTPAVTSTANAQSPRTLMFLRDSQGNALGPQFQASYATTVNLSHAVDGTPPLDVMSAVATYHPNVVVYELTERFLTFVP